MMHLRNSLGARLVAIAVAASAAVLIVLNGVVMLQNRAAIEHEVYGSARAVAEGAANGVKGEFDGAFEAVNAVARAFEAMRLGGADRRVMDATLKRVLEQHPAYLGTYTGWEPDALDGRDRDYANAAGHDASGRYVPYWIRSGGQIKVEALVDYDKPGAGDYYLIPARQGKEALLDPYSYKVDGKDVLMISLVTPIVVNGKPVGMVGVDFPLTGLSERLGRIKPYETGFVSLISSARTYATNPDAAKIGKPADDVPKEAFESIGAGQRYEYRSGDLLHVVWPIAAGRSTSHWGLRVSIPMSVALAPANRSMWIGIGLSVIALVLLGLLLGWLLRRTLLPVRKLDVAMNELAGGAGDLTRRLDVATGDEIGRICGSFNALMQQLQGMVREVKAEGEGIAAATAQLETSSNAVAHASREQADSASATAASVEEVTVSVGVIAENAGDAAGSSRATGELASKVSHTIAQTAIEIESVNSRVQDLAAVLQRLDERSAEIGAVVAVIKDVADQTNLLALNAAIEAARAGEQGRGFAVVADEVRKLAERTSKATVEIAGTVERIQEETREAASGMGTVAGQVTRGAEAAREAAARVGEIEGTMSEVVRKVEEIANSTREQSAASNEIAVHIERISSMAQDNDAQVSRTVGSVADLTQRAVALGTIVGRFRV
jgi:methyl-accepting chemotaxis protein